MAAADLSGDMEIKMPLMEEEEESRSTDSIPKSASIASSIMSLASTPAGSAAMGWVSERRQKVKPWSEFVNSKRYGDKIGRCSDYTSVYNWGKI